MKNLVLIFVLLLCACWKDETISGQTNMSDIWKLAVLNGIPATSAATISFPEKGRISGKGPCNSFFGQQSAPLPWFDAGPIASTRKACSPGIMKEEREYFIALEKASLIEKVGDKLILSLDGEILAEFIKSSEN